MAIHLVGESPEATTRLADLGLRVEDIHEAHQAGRAEFLTYTAHDRVGAAGGAGLSRVLRVMSDRLVADGWVRTNPLNLGVLTHPGREHSLVVSSGDALTGSVFGAPRTRNPKGPATARLVARNNTLMRQNALTLFALDQEPLPEEFRIATWVLLVAEVDGVLLAEVSFPVAMAGSWVTDWAERIIVPSLDTGEGGSWTLVEDGPDYDFDVSAKA